MSDYSLPDYSIIATTEPDPDGLYYATIYTSDLLVKRVENTDRDEAIAKAQEWTKWLRYSGRPETVPLLYPREDDT